MAMNLVVLTGRLTKDPELKYGASGTAYCRFTIAVGRAFQKDQTDFINCVAFGRSAEFAEKYLKQGTKIVATGRIQTGSYTNKDGVKVYTTEVIADEIEFAESKNSSAGADGGFSGNAPSSQPAAAGDGFMNIPDGIDEELPFN